jgi:hypothetical protein
VSCATIQIQAFELKAIGADASLDWLDEFRLTDEEVAALKDPEWAIENIAPSRPRCSDSRAARALVKRQSCFT